MIILGKTEWKEIKPGVSPINVISRDDHIDKRFSWTAEEEELIRKHYPVSGVVELRVLLPHYSENRIRNKASYFGLKSGLKENRPPKIIKIRKELTDENKSKIIELYNQGISYHQIALQLDFRSNSIRKFLKKEGLFLNIKHKNRKQHNWTEEETEILLLNLNLETQEIMKLLLGIADTQIRSRCRLLGIKREDKRLLTEDEMILVRKKLEPKPILKIGDKRKNGVYEKLNKEQLYDLYHNQRKSSGEIAKLIDVSPSYVIKALHKYNISTREPKEARQVLKNSGYLTPTFEGIGDLSMTYFTEIKNRAAGWDTPFDLTIEWCWELFLEQNKKCAFTDMDITLCRSHRDHPELQTASLDRINSDIGYCKSNVWWTHKFVNHMKNKYDESFFRKVCRLVVEKEERAKLS